MTAVQSPAIQAIFDAACAHKAKGHVVAATGLLRLVLEFQPAHGAAFYLLGMIAHERHQPAMSYGMIRQALCLPDAQPLYAATLAYMLAADNRAEEAVDLYNTALALKPDYLEALNNLGNVLRDLGQPLAALERYDAALRVAPAQPEVLNNRGNALRDLHRHMEALQDFDAALAARPGYPEALNNRGNALRDLQRPVEALASYDKALAVRPGFAEAHNNRGNALKDLDHLDAALASYEAALTLKPDYPEALHNRGNTLRELDRPLEALADYDRALALRPNFADAYCDKGIALSELGSFDHAAEAIAAAIRIVPDSARFRYNLTLCRRLDRQDPQFQGLEQLAADAGKLNVNEQIHLHFAMGKILADAGDRQESFRHLLAGNRLKRDTLAYDEDATMADFDRIATAFTPDLMQRHHGGGASSDAPIFILGMPRSGSTLVEQVLASHPAVFAAGEIADFEKALADAAGHVSAFPDIMGGMSDAQLDAIGHRYLTRIRQRSPDQERISNKTPGNFRYAGLIHLALPNAKIIHTRRDPVDTCVSCFSHLFAKGLAYTYDLAELGRYYRAYSRLMDHWRAWLPPSVMIEIQYEDLVADFEAQARRIVAHCGLPWDANCLAFHETRRPVRTASMAQVRQPLYRGSIGRWRAIEPLLGPLVAALSPASTVPEPA